MTPIDDEDVRIVPADEASWDDGVRAVTCFAVRKGYRGRGPTRLLARAAVDFARARGAGALEGCPVIAPPGKLITWGELHVGVQQVFREAGFEEVGDRTVRRVVLRGDLDRLGAERPA